MSSSNNPSPQPLIDNPASSLATPPSPDQSVVTPASTGKRRVFRFNAATDVLLLREVTAKNPYAMGYGRVLECWKEISAALNAAGGRTAWRACRDRSDKLIEQYKQEDRESLRRSGTAEEYEEKERLLQELVELRQEAEANRMDSQATRQETQAREQQTAMEIRNAATSTLSPSIDTEGSGCDSFSAVSSARSRKRRAQMDLDCQQMLRDAEDRRRLEAENRSEELQLRRAEMEMEREKINQDREEKRRMWEIMERIASKLGE